MYKVVGKRLGHLIFQKTWKSFAPSTWAASTRDLSMFPMEAMYNIIGWPTAVVSKMIIIAMRAYFLSPSHIIFLSIIPAPFNI